MLGEINSHVARALLDERARAADARGNAAAAQLPVANGKEASERQRALVVASLLLSRRRDPSTKRRWA